MNDTNTEWDFGIKTSGFHSACVNSWYRPMITEIFCGNLGPNDKMTFETVPAHTFYEINNFDKSIVNLIDDLILHFRMIYSEGPWIAGGLMRRAIQGEKLNGLNGDIDIFVKDETQIEDVKERFKTLAINNDIFKLSEDYIKATELGGNVGQDGKMLVSPFAESFFFDYCGIPIKIQIITYKHFKSLPLVFTHFDLFCCMLGTDGANVTYEVNHTISDIHAKKLHFNWSHLDNHPGYQSGDEAPNAYLIMRRLTKFISEGYIIDNKDLKRLTALIHTLPQVTFQRQEHEYNNL